MKIEPLNSEYLSAFTSICQAHPERYYFFQLDRKLYPSIIKIQLIVNDSDQICGMIGSYPEWNSIRIVGEKPAIASVLPKIELNQYEIFFPKDLEESILKRISSPVTRTDHIRLIYNTSPTQRDENIPPHVQKLTSQDLPAIQSVLSRADPEAWSDYIPKIDNNRFWYGIKNNNKKLFSVAGGWNECDTSFLLCVATDPDYQRQGYASKLFNSLLSYLMADVKQVMVETLMNKTAARNLYTHLGFTPMYEYIVLHVNNVNTE
jgi:GNAT superfamily N-acetyltransferase